MSSAAVTWVVGGLLVLLLLAAVTILVRPGLTGTDRRSRPHRDSFRAEADLAARPPKRAAMIVNPTKFTDLADLLRRLTAACAAAGWDAPLILQTTAEQTGAEQAREAVAAGCDVLCALGGDGTVRSVAEGLAGGTVPLGLLPAGTGNLLARNLGMQLDDLEDAVRVALTGRNERVDVGRLEVDFEADGTADSSHIFLVMAGMGFDAAIMGDAPEQLKAKVGWPAYVVSGMKNLRGERFKARLEIGPGGGTVVERKCRTVVIGNCGKLMGGIALLPDARIDDGLLDLVALSPKTVAGWVVVTAKVMRRNTDATTQVDHYTEVEFAVTSDRAEPVQIDGDVLGVARRIHATIWPRALIVRR